MRSGDETAETPQADSGAYKGFRGRVGKTFADSEPWWPPPVRASQGAPNIVIVLADDLGFSDIGCYGSEIETPNLDRIAARGLRFSDFHVAPLCSPTRAALMTGLNSHAAGVGFPTQIDPGFPGYASELPENQPTLPEILRGSGYSTLMVGKWHLCKETDLSEAGSRHSWPLQRGFDQFYGFLEALTNFHHPHRLYEGNSAVHVDQYPEGYYLTDDLTDRAVQMIREVKTADPAKPFFLYFSHGAVHAPMHAKPQDIDKYRGRYDIGWDEVRTRRLAKQIANGVMPPGTRLPPRNSEEGEATVAWDTLGRDEKRLFARYMEVYAAMVDSIDQSVGRVAAELEALDALDNTIFIFTSDNGAARLRDRGQADEGEVEDTGTTSYFGYIAGGGPQADTIARDLERIDEIGGPTTWPHYPRGWAMACNTPFRLYKFSTFRGGHQVPMIFSWPAGKPARNEIVRRQFTHVTDVLPTLLDIIGIEVPHERNGRRADDLAGTSFAFSFEDPEAPGRHGDQCYECIGNRGFYRDGWEAVTVRRPLTPFRDEHWHLFDVEKDPTQCHDLSRENPALVEELKEAWEQAAWRNQVFPLDEGSGLKFLRRPPHDRDLAVPVRILPGTPTLERHRSSLLIDGRSFQIVVDWSYRPGAEGVLVAHGGQEAGYVLYVEDGTLCFEQNQYGVPKALPPVPLTGESGRVVVDVQVPGGGRWAVSLHVDGREVVSGDGFSQLAGFLPFGGIDVGVDRRSPVSWDLHTRRGTFPFSGTLHSVTYVPGVESPDRNEERIRQAIAVGIDLQ